MDVDATTRALYEALGSVRFPEIGCFCIVAACARSHT